MTDRELLELAARAAGKSIRWEGEVCVLNDPDWSHDKCSAWNPLTDDGDALRLAVKLGLMVDVDCVDGNAYAWAVEIHPKESEGEIEALNADPYAATRRAIVRAAASLGSGTTLEG